jgi:hypothetical protein
MLVDYAEFFRAFQMVVEYMLANCEYNEAAFRRYMKKLFLNPGKGQSGVNERQADYVKYLYIENNRPHYSIKEAQEIWQYTFDNLERNRKDFEEKYDQAKKDKEAADLRRLQALRDDLMTMYGKGPVPILTSFTNSGTNPANV